MKFFKQLFCSHEWSPAQNNLLDVRDKFLRGDLDFKGLAKAQASCMQSFFKTTCSKCKKTKRTYPKVTVRI